MGGTQSTHEQPPLLSTPWRTINWKDYQTPLQYVESYKLPSEGKQIRILLHGPVGAGKSSFINSVQSVLHGRIYVQALSDTGFKYSFTEKYTAYKIQKGDQKSFYPFVFNDIMGLSPVNGVLVDDVKLALMGHVKEGYKFNIESKLSDADPHFIKSPTDNDKVHILVCVINADNLTLMHQATLQQIREIRGKASELGIPQVVILTKIDKAYPELKENLRNVYKVASLKNQMEQFSADVGIPMNCMFPVKNYSEEIELNSDTDCLILSALRNIINFGADSVNFRTNPSGRLD
ncbi:interferon-induced protein 44-like [Labrus bergylta]|uniref:interferon-induced protein 44-like n=1 Tax=Labrus bergylta TaxID=56723 RepID=UPI0009B39357|nr:interferon-induced protein 44-like [Labrus bergylta]XP_020515059.1 interferon-induced protein 44-like [Labrus bergylta]XP_020515060.1 interferon-induced protein 44-like [Labrus bergylta]